MSGTLAVVSQSGTSLSFFDIASGERTGHMPDLIPEPHELILDSKRNLLYLSHSYRHGHFWKHGDCGHEISVIDPVSREVVDIISITPCLGPHGLAIDTKRDTLWCSYEEDEVGALGGLVGIDLNSRKVVKRIESTAKTHWFALAADGTKAYTCNKTEEFISVLDLEEGRMTGKISSPSTEECDVSRDGKLVYFPTPGTQIGKNPDTPQVLVIDTSTDDITAKIPLEHGASSLHVSEDGKLMVGQYRFGSGESPSPMVRDGCLSVYDQSYKLQGAVDVGKLPLTVKSSKDGKLAFVANIFAGSVSVIDVGSMEVIRTLIVDTKIKEISNMCQGAHGMVHVDT